MAAPSVLAESCKFGSLTLKNRVVLAPMTRGRSINKIPGPEVVDYYTQRSGAGFLITESTNINEEGSGIIQAPGIYNEAQVEGWKKVTDSVHRAGGVIFMQLWHMGRQSHSDFFGTQPVAPSAIVATGDSHTPSGKKPYEVPRALDIGEIPRLVEDFRKAAANAKLAGFDGVEIHSSNGHLLDTFLQSVSNQRTDEFGGSAENRFRLHRLVIEAIATVFPRDRIGIRFSPNGMYGSMGSADNMETFAYAIGEVNKLGLGYVHLMDGLGFGFHGKSAPFRLYDARKHYNGLLIGNVGYTKQTAEGAIATGVVDAISFGRPYISNPDLAQRFINNLPLNEDASYGDWYNTDGENLAKGYTDFPAAAVVPPAAEAK